MSISQREGERLDEFELEAMQFLRQDTLQANAVRSVAWAIFYVGRVLRWKWRLEEERAGGGVVK